ncbi:type II toxin-antitoxin system RelE/ParE family toxin [Halotia branconii CENA392]|uniref:Type II toxin-antitoxin system RelE/ParE family toxin n=1 Tax=Halotia branconii CENA392 TaxID=1539056 RepID=A0AAJ6NWR3_9CYAN|nr:type II toxin-antitoxin system RelE/ParE family toxin [Halotia branconii]WGV28153.1 type II toxin-antitoxin system RelE/ParE family toxin [Halotia branconii CENA392]
MNYRLIVKDRATQDLRYLANYILVNGNTDTAVKFLSAAEVTFAQLQKTPGMVKVTQLVVSRLGEIRQWRIKFRLKQSCFMGQGHQADCSRLMSRIGGAPNRREYSRLNCEGLSYPT